MVFRSPYPLDHMTHMPILIGLAHSFFVRRILEYGAGNYSTPLFLNKEVFSEVEEVISVETDRTWLDMVTQRIGQDDRLNLVESHPLPDNSFDLVFIDNGPCETKTQTIHDVICSDYRGLVVVHDSEVGVYSEELKRVSNRFDFRVFMPETAVVGSPTYLAHLHEVIERHRYIPFDDVISWRNVFGESNV